MTMTIDKNANTTDWTWPLRTDFERISQNEPYNSIDTIRICLSWRNHRYSKAEGPPFSGWGTSICSSPVYYTVQFRRYIFSWNIQGWTWHLALHFLHVTFSLLSIPDLKIQQETSDHQQSQEPGCYFCDIMTLHQRIGSLKIQCLDGSRWTCEMWPVIYGIVPSFDLCFVSSLVRE